MDNNSGRDNKDKARWYIGVANDQADQKYYVVEKSVLEKYERKHRRNQIITMVLAIIIGFLLTTLIFSCARNTKAAVPLTHTKTPHITVTATATKTPTPTDTPTDVPTATPTATATDTPTATATATQTSTATDTVTPTATDTATQTDTPTATQTNTVTPTGTLTPSETPTITQTGTATITPSGTPKPPTNTPTSTRTPRLTLATPELPKTGAGDKYDVRILAFLAVVCIAVIVAINVYKRVAR